MESLKDGKKERVDNRQWIKEEHASSGMKSLPPSLWRNPHNCLAQ